MEQKKTVLIVEDEKNIVDILRFNLQREGYETQILEFIDMEHTPKNILIRAVKTGRKGSNEKKLQACEEALHVRPTLGRLLDTKSDAERGTDR